MTSPYTFIALEFFALAALGLVLAMTITRVARLAKRIEDQDARLRRAHWQLGDEPGAKTLPFERRSKNRLRRF